MSPEIEAEFRRLQELVLDGDEVIRHGQGIIKGLVAETNQLRREVAQLCAELEVLRGEGCREKKLDEPESGPCGVCIRCAEERGAYWAITELPHAGRPGMLPEVRARAAAEAGRARARMVK